MDLMRLSTDLHQTRSEQILPVLKTNNYVTANECVYQSGLSVAGWDVVQLFQAGFLKKNLLSPYCHRLFKVESKKQSNLHKTVTKSRIYYNQTSDLNQYKFDRSL